MPARPLHVLVLTADVGEGHLAAGRALEESLAGHPGVSVEIRDGLQVRRDPGLAREIADAGQSIALHGDTHLRPEDDPGATAGGPLGR